MRTREEILMDWAEFKIKEMPNFDPKYAWAVADLPNNAGSEQCSLAMKWDGKLWLTIIELHKSCDKNLIKDDIIRLTKEFSVFGFVDATTKSLYGPDGSKIDGSDWYW